MDHGRRHAILRHLRRWLGGRATADLSDRQLLERFATGHEESAFATLVERHGSLVRGVCWRALRHTQDAEDVFQATFLVLAKKASALRWQESIGSWLYQVAYRLALKSKVSAARRAAREREAGFTEDESAHEQARREICEALDEELHQLPDRYRAPLLLCYLDGKTRDEAAVQLGWSLGTLKRRLERGRELLRERLTRRGVTFSAGLLASILSEGATSAGLPASLRDATVQAAMAFAQGKSGPSAAAAFLADGMLRGMTASKLRLVVGAAFALCVLAAGTGVYLSMNSRPEFTPTAETDGTDAGNNDNQPAPAIPVQRDGRGDMLPPDALARLGTLRLQHAGRIAALAFAPDGRAVASAGEDAAIRLWDAETGAELRQFVGHEEGVRALAFSPDGRLLISGGFDDAVRVWDPATGKLVRRLPVGYSVCGLALAADNRTVAVAGSFEKRLCLWDAVAGKEIRSLGGERDVVSGVVFSPNGNRLAAVGEDKVIHVWDMASGRELPPLTGHQDRPWSVTFSSNGKQLLSGGKDGTVRLWDVAAGRELHRLDGHRGDVWSVAFSGDGSLAASGGQDGTVRVWDTQSGKLVRQFATAGEVQTVAFSPKSQTLAAGGHGRVVLLWNAGTGQELCRFARQLQPITALTYSADGKTLATSGADGPRLWDATTGRELSPFAAAGGRVTTVAFACDGQTLFTRSDDRRFRVWSIAERKVLHEYRGPPNNAAGCACSPDGRTVALREGNQVVRLIDASTGAVHREWKAPQSNVGYLAFAPDGRTLALGEGGSIRLWDAATGKEFRHFPGPQEVWLTHIAFTPDGQHLAAVIGSDPAGLTPGNVHLYAIETGAVRRGFGGRPAFCTAFAPDGRTLATAGPDHVVRLWDVATATERRQFSGHRDRVTVLAFSPDGKTFTSGSADSTALIWKVTP